MYSVVDIDRGDLLSPQITVPGLTFLQMRRQIDPKLEPDVGASIWVLPWHLCVHDSPPRRHELQVARLDGACVAGEVFVIDGAAQEVCDWGERTTLLAGRIYSGKYEEGKEGGVEYSLVSWPRCGWSGKPAPGLMLKWSSIRKGEKLRS